MDTVVKKAYAKLNLTLGVLSKRPDGYHALDSLMQGIDLYDTVTVTRAADVTVTVTGMLLPYDNTLRKAAERYRALTGRGAYIRVVKRIPCQAGMGGGSADGAAVLSAMQDLYGELDEGTLFDAALDLGADVPFCLYAQRRGSLARAEGVGELLTPLSGPPLFFAVVKPEPGVSTRALFTGLALPTRNPDTAAALQALSAGDVPALGSLLHNALEAPAVSLVPEIGSLKTRLLSSGALGAAMTGSGSAVFGLFPTPEAAQAAAALFSDAAFSCACRSL